MRATRHRLGPMLAACPRHEAAGPWCSVFSPVCTTAEPTTALGVTSTTTTETAVCQQKIEAGRATEREKCRVSEVILFPR